MATLAESFLADLEDLSDVEEEEPQQGAAASDDDAEVRPVLLLPAVAGLRWDCSLAWVR